MGCGLESDGDTRRSVTGLVLHGDNGKEAAGGPRLDRQLQMRILTDSKFPIAREHAQNGYKCNMGDTPGGLWWMGNSVISPLKAPGPPWPRASKNSTEYCGIDYF